MGKCFSCLLKLELAHESQTSQQPITEMTTQDRARLAIPLLQAIVEGKTLQKLITDGDCWRDCPEGDWLAEITMWPELFRIKPEPRQWWLLVYKNDPTDVNSAYSRNPTDKHIREDLMVVHVIEAQ